MVEKNRSYIPGLVLVAVGVLLLLRQLHVLYFGWREFFPILLLVLGGMMFVQALNKEDKGSVFPATILLVLGLFFTLRQYGLFSIDYYFYYFDDYWPIFLIAVGSGFVVLYLFRPKDWGVLIPGGILLFFGVLFTLRTIGVIYWRDFVDYWPIILIAIGLSIVLNNLKRKPQ
ncbi:MAG: LiaI-LiaF-like domain-containing protein [bacterium]